MKKNIKDKKSVSDDVYDDMIKDIESIHVLINETQFISRVKLFEDKYKQDHSDMYHYISKQWFTGRYNKWQIFRTPPWLCCNKFKHRELQCCYKTVLYKTRLQECEGGLETLDLTIRTAI